MPALTVSFIQSSLILRGSSAAGVISCTVRLHRGGLWLQQLHTTCRGSREWSKLRPEVDATADKAWHLQLRAFLKVTPLFSLLSKEFASNFTQQWLLSSVFLVWAQINLRSVQSAQLLQQSPCSELGLIVELSQPERPQALGRMRTRDRKSSRGGLSASLSPQTKGLLTTINNNSKSSESSSSCFLLAARIRSVVWRKWLQSLEVASYYKNILQEDDKSSVVWVLIQAWFYGLSSTWTQTKRIDF